ncbi:MAG TPA: indolepyruvate oxidoreductase subunit beta family protein [Candidatus Cybelea sp.]|nr:indolepyruvate oxidoreductase subunit beta family protein [Candidatus Cybelea sp.]
MTAKPVSVLIAALGGEGGGVLTDWLVDAALRADLPVQGTSIPGVAQRTGATTYYVEVHPETNAALEGRRPVFGLYPSVGDLDVMVASELLEAGRAIENGFVTPDRTVLIAATHRIFATIEKMQMADGRFDESRVFRAAREMPKRAILFDLTRRAETRSQPLNAVLLGAIAGSGKLPIAETHYRAAIVASGIAVEPNLAGFALGLDLAQGRVELLAPPPKAPAKPATDLPALIAEAVDRVPAACLDVVERGIARLGDYQDAAYARLYLDRLYPVLAAGGTARLGAEVARHLALWMAYEDVIRVADLKSRPERLAKVREEVRAQADEPVAVTEFFKPGIDEIAAILPQRLGRAVQGFAERFNLVGRLNVAMPLKSTSITGYARLRMLARLKPWRRKTLRYAEEQALIERWLEAVRRAAPRDPALALEIAACARLLKGYSDTYRRGRGNFLAIMDRIVHPALNGMLKADAAEAVRTARDAALADPDGAKLAQALDMLPRTAPEAVQTQTINAGQTGD